MIEYLKIVNKNFKNKGYFASLINRHQSLKNKAQQKKETFFKLRLMGAGSFAVLCFLSYFIFNNFNLLFIALFSVPMAMSMEIFKNYVGKQELQYMEEIEYEFFKDLKENHDFIKDLSKLVVDDDTEESFNEIVDNVVQDVDDTTFDSFHNLLYNYDCVQSEKDVINDRNSFLKTLKIDVRQDIDDEEENEEYFQ